MNGQRNIRPPGHTGAGGRREASLQPVTPRHLALLRGVESPLVYIVEILQRGADCTTEDIRKFCEQHEHYTPAEIRPSIYILATNEADLDLLEALGPEQIHIAASEAIQPPDNPALLALGWQIMAMHIGAAMERIKNLETQNN